jgi:hypothetical protein
MCPKHWRLVDPLLQALVDATYQTGQERMSAGGEVRPTPAYMAAAHGAIACVAKAEGHGTGYKYHEAQARRWLERSQAALKGALGGLCNRAACQAPGARYYNHSTRAHYCDQCAAILNRENRDDAMRLYGHELCTEVAA